MENNVSEGDEGSPDAVRAALARQREVAQARGHTPTSAPSSMRRGSGRVRRRFTAGRGGMSGPGPDRRDPQTLSVGLKDLVTERGWTTPLAVGGAVGRWEQIVGADIAANTAVENFDDTTLTVRALSTAWATQLRLLTPHILALLDAELGRGVVTKLQVLAPAQRSWIKGPRTIRGARGPRDTYG